MDRAMIEQALTMVERHITLGLHHIERQVQIMARLRRQGHFVAGAQLHSQRLQASVRHSGTNSP
jgi:hypothetical protein